MFGIEKSMIKMKDGFIHIAKQYFGDNYKIRISKRNKNKFSDIEINHDSRFHYYNNKWRILIPIPIEFKNKENNDKSLSGIDLGVKKTVSAFVITNDYKSKLQNVWYSNVGYSSPNCLHI